MSEANAIPLGRCQCGCGAQTEIWTRTNRKNGAIKGEPRRWIRGHHKLLSPVEYIEEDRGHHTPCWIWQRAKDRRGYGRVNVGGGKTRFAHTVYFQRAQGPVPPGLELDHLCRQPACVNSDHLEPVTHAENVRRGRGGDHSRQLTGTRLLEVCDLLRQGWQCSDIAEAYGLNRSSIHATKRRKRIVPVAKAGRRFQRSS